MGKQKGNADFKVIKKKIGRKAKPANATSTKFESKKVIIREQSVVTDAKEESIVSSRGLSVEQLTAQTKHHNSRVRREAFQQLTELSQEKFDVSPQLRRSFILSLESLAEGMRDEDKDTRISFLVMLTTLCMKKDENLKILTTQHFTTFMNNVVATLTGPLLSRRLDATKVIDILTPTFQKLIETDFAHKLIPFYTDLCRTVLGTTTSSLAKGANLSMIQQQEKTGKIMQNVKREETLASSSSKKKRLKTTENAVVTAEMSLVLDRLRTASKAVNEFLKLDFRFSNVEEAQQFTRAILELFRHSEQYLNTDSSISIFAGEATALVFQKCSNLLGKELYGDAKEVFSIYDNKTRIFFLRRASLLTSFCGEDEEWISQSIHWYLSDSQCQEDLKLTSILLSSSSLRENHRDQIIHSFSENLKQFNPSNENALLQLKIVNSLLLKVQPELKREWMKLFPSVLWSYSQQTSDKRAENEEEILSLCFQIMKKSALLEEEEKEEWVEIARSLSPLFCAFTKSSSLIGPFPRYSSTVQNELISLIYSLPIKRLPSILLKSWCEMIKKSSIKIRNVLLIELAFHFLERNYLDASTLEATLSFVLTLGLFDATCFYTGIALKHSWFSNRLPFCSLLTPALCNAYSSGKNDKVWIEFASFVLTCQDEVEEELTSKLAEVIGLFWSQSTKGEEWKLSSYFFTNLTGKISPANVFDKIITEEHHHIDFLLGWTEILLQNESLSTFWRIETYPTILTKAKMLSNENKELESNMKLLKL